jgi:hypothetical protein
MDSRIANEMRNLGNNWSYGVAQWQFYEFFNYLDNTSGLLTDLHAKIWGEENIQYDTVFTDYLDNSEATDSDLIILALQIVVMNYQYYNFS